ncbi:MAG: oligopeptidase B, partial [Propionibacteriaceae bacterium]
MYAEVPPTSAAPIAKRHPMTRRHHGDVFVDPYEWLREKASPEVISYLEAENAYTEAQTAQVTKLSEAVFSEIKARTKETDLTVPNYTAHPGGAAYWYYVRTVEGSEYPIYCRVVASDREKLPDPEQEIVGEEVLLDANVEADGHEFFSLGAF